MSDRTTVKKPVYPKVTEPVKPHTPPSIKDVNYTIDPRARLKIVTLMPEFLDLVIEAQFNPKEVQVDVSVPWSKHSNKHGVGHLEYTGTEPRVVSLELLLDGVESQQGIGAHLTALEQLHQHMPGAKLPPPLKLVWGAATSADNPHLPGFPVVLESLSIKRTMFSGDGICVRALATLKLKEIPEGGLKFAPKKT